MTSDRDYQKLAMRIFADFSASIAVPAVLCALLGKWLDNRYGTAPWLLIASFIVAFGLTAFSIYRKSKKYSKQYNRLNNDSDGQTHVHSEGIGEDERKDL
ncbi:MAG: AtpZ/AtpI family protein [Patescibacteria group bacterium]